MTGENMNPNYDFIALDVETANSHYSSICQIGMVEFSNGKILNEWQSLINPEVDFNPFNIRIHGITQNMVENSPTFPGIFQDIERFIDGKIVSTYTSFDFSSFMQVTQKYKCRLPRWKWLDRSRVVRHTWVDYARDGYSLAIVAADLGIRFKHHDALEDAKAAGKIFHCAMVKTGKGFAQ